jgi:hypothetical protein
MPLSATVMPRRFRCKFSKESGDLPEIRHRRTALVETRKTASKPARHVI